MSSSLQCSLLLAFQGAWQVAAAIPPSAHGQEIAVESSDAFVDASGSKIKVACVGDSITEGAVCGLRAQKMDYPAQLQRLLGSDYIVSNFGIGGHTMLKHGLCQDMPTDNCTGNCSYWGTAQYRDAIGSKPDVVLVMLGTNDAKKCNIDGHHEDGRGVRAFMTDYIDLIREFRDLTTHPKVYLLIPPPYVLDPRSSHTQWSASQFDAPAINEMYPVLIPRIATAANASGVIDIWDSLGGWQTVSNSSEKFGQEIYCDSLHPVARGYTAVVEAIQRAAFSKRASCSRSKQV
eukprot:TRINITY_DN106194_c0_g1_i1.p1 TRINITY_DN106194_c0_g1~~TRINITY_DN106194_c0_g1_i1.p1  ORF type:complete len:300 (-),score=30.09 TRINITY_DN106194_c0_g1_i1:358-1227(-)